VVVVPVMPVMMAPVAMAMESIAIRPVIAAVVMTMAVATIVRLLDDTVAALRSGFNGRKVAAADRSGLSSSRGNADTESQRHC